MEQYVIIIILRKETVTTSLEKIMKNISTFRKMDKWTKVDLSFATFHEFMKENELVAKSNSQYGFWMASWNFYKQLA